MHSNRQATPQGSNPAALWESFCDSLERTGFGEAPNGVSYRIIPWSRTDGYPWERIEGYAVEQTKDGHRRHVVGWQGETFASIRAAWLWARMDGRYEYKPGATLSERALLVVV